MRPQATSRRCIGDGPGPVPTQGASVPDILVVVNQLGIGGTEAHLRQVLPALAGRGFRIRLFSLGGAGEHGRPFERAGIPVDAPGAALRLPRGRIFGLPRRVLTAIALIGTLRRLGPKLVHCYLPEAYMTGALAARLAGIRTVAMSRRSLNDYQRRRPLLGWTERRLHRLTRFATANSRAVAEELVAEGFPPSNVALIHNGIAPGSTDAPSRTAIRQILGLPPDAIVFVMVANLLAYKGHAALLSALAAAAPCFGKPWRVLFPGEDRGLGIALQRQAMAAGLADNILWLGPRGDVRELLAAADVGLLTSTGEGFSNAILEYMAAGLPVIATDVGGNPEAVVDGRTGILVPPDAVEPLANALVSLARDPETARRMGAEGRRRVEECFSLDTCLDRYERVYRAILSGAEIPPCLVRWVDRPNMANGSR